ncbi:hypothetical protein PN441_03625 [Spirulina major CS-329]|uniref:hypothetical protein n=1 Tax=Spirulina TaxID=1154 RepID=UPI00232E1C99|nr:MULTISPECIES: hypothetical protein [Spirulina]MDB9496617.1 hypothetical protein [Spirulina subsalsa CS-330]MDB9502148.1 hypothetical protein [Spirulina major CS-329]
MLNAFWNWLKRLWQRLTGRRTSPPPAPVPPTPTAPQPLSATDYEFLFTQLLEGVSHGWTAPRIEKFFDQVSDRTTLTDWVNWLLGFGQSAIASPHPNLELARRLDLLARQTQNIPNISEIGAVSNAISTQLMLRQSGGVVWEYDGPDQ